MSSARLAPLLALVLVTACVKVEPPKPPLVETVAVLPFDSVSNDLNAPDVLQELVHRALASSVYRPIPFKEVNEKLASVGIVDGGQLAIVDPVKLGKDLGVQALMFGYVAAFGHTNIGYFASRKVTVELKLVDVSTGETLWEGTGTGANRKMTLDPAEAKRNLAEGLAQQTVDKLAKSVLGIESREAVAAALRTLPGFRFSGFQGAPEKATIQIGGPDTSFSNISIKKRK